MYPSTRYHPEKEPVIVKSAEHEASLGPGWHQSPADYGVETCPSHKPDPAIIAKKEAFEAMKKQAAPTASVDSPKRKGKAK